MGYLQRLTVPGANAYAVRDYDRERARALRAAVDSVEGSLTRFAPPSNPYSRQLATRLYDSPGIGDVDGDTSWMGVLNTAVGNVSQGVANLIGGRPQTTVINQQPEPKSFPWVPVVAVAGGAAVLLLLMKRGRR